jgi:hypothetical protein
LSNDITGAFETALEADACTAEAAGAASEAAFFVSVPPQETSVNVAIARIDLVH